MAETMTGANERDRKHRSKKEGGCDQGGIIRGNPEFCSPQPERWKGQEYAGVLDDVSRAKWEGLTYMGGRITSKSSSTHHWDPNYPRFIGVPWPVQYP